VMARRANRLTRVLAEIKAFPPIVSGPGKGVPDAAVPLLCNLTARIRTRLRASA
jgi:hypothetical protein